MNQPTTPQMTGDAQGKVKPAYKSLASSMILPEGAALAVQNPQVLSKLSSSGDGFAVLLGGRTHAQVAREMSRYGVEKVLDTVNAVKTGRSSPPAPSKKPATQNLDRSAPVSKSSRRSHLESRPRADTNLGRISVKSAVYSSGYRDVALSRSAKASETIGKDPRLQSGSSLGSEVSARKRL